MTELEQLIKEFQKKQSAGKVLHNDMRGLPGENAPVVVNVAIVNNQLIFKFSDGKEFNAGILPLPLHGNDGVDGKDGEDGISASNIEEISIKDNNLIITFDDGREINAGSLHKPQDGIAGVGVENVEVRDNKFVFTLTDGTEIIAGEIRVPSDGVGVQNVKLVRNELLVTLTNGKVINAGNVPLPEKGVGIDKIYPSGNDVIAELTDGRKFSVGSMPKPIEGVGIRDLNIEDGRLNVVLTDGSTVDAGELPKQDAVPLLPVNNIISAEIDAGRLIFTTENGEKIDAGELPVERVMSGGVTGAFVYEVVNNAVISIANLTVANFASPNVSQWTNDAGYITSSSLTGYVPYTGATADLNLGAHSLIAHSILPDATDGLNIYAANGTTQIANLGAANTANVTWYGSHNFNAATANTIAYFGASKTLSSITSVNNAVLTTNGSGVPSLSTTLPNINIGTPTAGVLTNCTGLPLTTGITGILPIANGGTNTNTQTSFGMCYYDGTKLTTSPYATMSFIAGDIDLLIMHPSVTGTVYEVLVTSSSSQYIMSYNTASTFQGICGTAATENYWTLSTKGLGLSVSAVALWFGSTSNDDMSFYRNNTERLRLTTTGIYVPDVAYLSAASPTINAMVTGTTLIQSSVRLISAYSGAASANSSYFLGSGNDGGLLQVFGAGGTIASPTALTTDSRMGGVFGRGYAATGYSNAAAAVTFHAETTFTDTSTPTYIAFATTASGATTRTEAMRITASGNTGVNVVPTAKFHVAKALYETPSLTFGSDCATIIRGENAELAFGFGYPSYAGMYLQARYSTNISLPLFLNPVGGDVLIGTSTSLGKVTVNLGGPGTSLYLGTGNSGNYNAFIMGRASADATIGIASGVGQFSTSAVAGDCVIRNESSSKALILQAGTGSAVVYVTNSNVGVNTTPSYRCHINENQGYSSRNANPLPAQLVVQSGASGFLKIGNYYTGGVGTCSAIQSTDLFSGADHGVNLLLNPLGGNVGIGEDTPNFTLVARYASAYPQISARYDGTSPSNHKELELGYNGATGSGYGWIQAIHNGTAYTPLCLNPYGSYVGIGTLNPEEILHIAKAGSGTIGARILLENTASYATNNACEIGFLTDGGASVSSYNANIKAVQDGSGIAHTALTFGTYNGGGTPAERVRISPAGDVSIGIAASARAKLEVAGDIWTDWNDRFIGTVYLTGSAYKMGFATTTATRNLDLIAMSADTSAIRFWTGSTPSVNMYLDYVSNVVLGNQSALATNATNGFVYIRTCAGTPTGAPTAFTGHVAMVYDTTNNKLYCYNSAWKSVTLT